MKKLITILFLLLAATAFSQVTTTPLTRQFLTNYTELGALNRLGPETNITQILKSNQLSGTGTLLGPVTSWTEVIFAQPESSNITENSHIDFTSSGSLMSYDSTNLLKSGWYKIKYQHFMGDFSSDNVKFTCGGSDIVLSTTANTQWIESIFFAPTNNSFIRAELTVFSATHAGFTNLSIQPVIFSRSNVVGHAESEYTVGNFDNLFTTNLVTANGVPLQPLNLLNGTNVFLSVVTNSGIVNITINAHNNDAVVLYSLTNYGSIVTNFNANFAISEQRIDVTTNIYFVDSSNKVGNSVRNISIILDNHSGSNRALFFNPSWKWLGTTYNPPITITNAKVGVLALKAWGVEETNVIAAFAVQP